MLNDLRILADNLYNENGDEKYSLIKNILSNDSCFFEMDADTAISILIDLNFDKEAAKKMYITLIDKENFRQ